MRQFLLALLFIPFTAFAEDFEQDGQTNWGRGDCHIQYYSAKADDSGPLNVGGTTQAEIGFCQDFNGTLITTANDESKFKCISPRGITTRIRDIWYSINEEALDVLEQCKIGLSTDWVGAKPYTYESWSTIDVGQSTANIANCDEIYNPEADGSMDDSKNTCHVSDPIGTFIATSGGDNNNNGWRMLVDEADSGTPDCTRLEALEIVVKAEICVVPLQ